MADTPKLSSPPKPGFLTRLVLSRKKWAAANIAPVKEIGQEDTYLYGAGTTTIASLLGHGARGGRARQIIYEKWMRMEGDPIISSALQLLVTSALGGHETSGDIVFVEKTVEAKKDKRLAAIADEISASLTHLFNKVAFHIAYTGAAYGDAYARIYANGDGVVDLHSDEMIRPQLVQPYEMGSRTVGFAVSVGERNFTRMDVSQLARLKMPRIQWIPQFGVVEKSLKIPLTENDIDSLPIMPSMVGGSLLYNAEEPYDNLTASLLGLVGQRWMDSIDEQIYTVNTDGMTEEQKGRFFESVKKMLLESKRRAEDAVKSGRPIMERLRHIIPIYGEKQVVTVSPANGGAPGRSATISIEDVLLHAKLLSGALGVDLSMLGFADQLSGGLGEGGFFRVSAQAAERARIIRVALGDFFNHVIDIHTANRYGFVFNAKNRPWEINFFGSISALEAEKQRTRLESMNAGMMLVQSMQQLKDMGASKNLMSEFLAKTMMLDEDQAKMYASIADAQQQDAGEDGGGFGGGRGQMDSAWNTDDLLSADAVFDMAGENTLEPVFTEYVNDPEGAIKRLLKEKKGSAHAVWKRKGLGTIDLVYGDARTGLAHIAHKHPQMLIKLPALIKRGKIVRKPGANKIFIVVDGKPPQVAVIALDWYGRAKAWVVTGYEDERGEFTGGLKTIDTGALDSASVEVLDADQRTPVNLHQTAADFNGGGFGGVRHGQMDSAALDWMPAEVLDGVGNMTSIPIPAQTVKWLGFDGSMTLRADLHALAERHTEYYEGDPEAVLADIQFVLKKPDDWFIHSGKRISIFRERRGSGIIPLVRIELEVLGGHFVARSVYVGGKRQIATKMNEKKRMLKRLVTGANLPEVLSVSEYLKIQGRGS